MTREEMLQIIREDFKRMNVPAETLAESEKRINEYYDRKEAALTYGTTQKSAMRNYEV